MQNNGIGVAMHHVGRTGRSLLRGRVVSSVRSVQEKMPCWGEVGIRTQRPDFARSNQSDDLDMPKCRQQMIGIYLLPLDATSRHQRWGKVASANGHSRFIARLCLVYRGRPHICYRGPVIDRLLNQIVRSHCCIGSCCCRAAVSEPPRASVASV